MTTVQTAMYAKQVLGGIPEDAPLGEYGRAYVYDDGQGNVVASLYLGSTTYLDPCGRYHHAVISPNGLTDRCVRFWESLERQLERRGLSLTSGEGSGDDNFAERWLRDSADEIDEEEAA